MVRLSIFDQKVGQILENLAAMGHEKKTNVPCLIRFDEKRKSD